MTNEERLIQYSKIMVGIVIGFWVLFELGQIVKILNEILVK